MYQVIGAPPFDAGAVKLTDAWPLPAVADTPVGAPGDGPRRDRVRRRPRARSFPTELCAVTVNV